MCWPTSGKENSACLKLLVPLAWRDSATCPYTLVDAPGRAMQVCVPGCGGVSLLAVAAGEACYLSKHSGMLYRHWLCTGGVGMSSLLSQVAKIMCPQLVVCWQRAEGRPLGEHCVYFSSETCCSTPAHHVCAQCVLVMKGGSSKPCRHPAFPSFHKSFIRGKQPSWCCYMKDLGIVSCFWFLLPCMCLSQGPLERRVCK